MQRTRIWGALGVIAGGLVFTLVSWAAEPSAGGQQIDPKAERILRQAGDLLRKTKQFSFEVTETFDDVRPSGQKLQFTNHRVVMVRRPNRVYAEVHGDTANRRFWYDGKTVTLLETVEKLYAQAKGGPDIDSTMDGLVENYGVVIPLMDLLYADPGRTLRKEVQTGAYLGLHEAGAELAYHLAFTGEKADWQVWINRGPRPLLRKVLITYKKLPGQPQYQATFDTWDLAPKLSEAQFTFRRPSGAQKIQIVPRDKQAEEAAPAAK